MHEIGIFIQLEYCFQEMSGDVYSSLLKALAMPDEVISCYPVRVSAGGAIAGLLEVALKSIFWIFYIVNHNIITVSPFFYPFFYPE